MQLSLHFPEAAWETIRRTWSAWWAGELDRPLIVLECIEPDNNTTLHYSSTYLGNYSTDLTAEELLELFIPRLQATHYLGDAFPRFWPNFGPGILAAFAGASVHIAQDTTWFSSLDSEDILDLHIDLQAENPWWRRVKAVTQAAVELWRHQLSIGITDLGGNLDVLAHLRGTQQLLLDLVDNPGEVDRLVGETNRLWLHCYDELSELTVLGHGSTCWGPCWSPGSGYLLQSDFSYMISPGMFKRYVLPDIAACCAALEYPFYHLDGRGHLPHLELLLNVERLRGIQWVPGDGQPQAEHWIPLIRRILESGKLCQVYTTGEGALSILREMDGKGLLLAINETLIPAQGEALLGAVRLLEQVH